MAHVLLVEDDQWQADCYQSWLYEHQVRHVRDIQAAVDAADDQRPDVIVLDMLLPYANGMQLLHILRSHADLAYIPVVFCSSSLPKTMPAAAYGVYAMLDKSALTPRVLQQAITGALHETV